MRNRLQKSGGARRAASAAALLLFAVLSSCGAADRAKPAMAPATGAVVLSPLVPADSDTPSRDSYGGVALAASDAPGVFAVRQIGDRWILVTPDGNPFWLRAVYSVDPMDGGAPYNQALLRKYGTVGGSFDWWTFVAQTVRRLRSWGFNALGEYSSPYTFPVATYGRTQTNAEAMPFLRMVNPASEGLTNRWGWARGPVKDIVYGTQQDVYTGYRSNLPDVFDDNFVATAESNAADRATATWAPIFRNGLAYIPWLIGTTTDDADYLAGFKRNNDAHIGWMVAVTAPTQQRNTQLNVIYSDSIVYSKLALRNFLAQKYGTIAALNMAWNSSYSTFDSDGGWARGRGFMDENGTHVWMGKDPFALAGTSAALKADLDAFLEQFAERYFSTVARAVRAASPRNLVFGPAALHNSRPEVLRAAGRHLDVVQVFVDQRQWPVLESVLDEIYSKCRKPLMVWLTIMAQPDSPLAAQPVPDWTEYPNTPSQSERGRLYMQVMRRLWAFKSSADGTHPIIGIDWWEWTDKTTGGENLNFGLVTNSDNGYDGREAVAAAGRDPWNFPTGGETRNYGDMLSSVRAIHDEIDAAVARELGTAPSFRDGRKRPDVASNRRATPPAKTAPNSGPPARRSAGK